MGDSAEKMQNMGDFDCWLLSLLSHYLQHDAKMPPAETRP